MVQEKSYWWDYYKRNGAALRRSARTVYYQRVGKTVFWIKPPTNYLEYCILNNLNPKIY